MRAGRDQRNLVFGARKPEHPIDLEGEVRLAQKEQRKARAGEPSCPAVARPAPVVLLTIDQDPRAVGVPVETVERAQAQRDTDPLERPQIVNVGLRSRAARVLADSTQCRLKRGVGRQGRAARPRRLPLGHARPRRGDRQPHQARARHRIRSRHAEPIAPTPIVELRRAEMVVDRFQRLDPSRTRVDPPPTVPRVRTGYSNGRPDPETKTPRRFGLSCGSGRGEPGRRTRAAHPRREERCRPKYRRDRRGESRRPNVWIKASDSPRRPCWQRARNRIASARS